MKKIIAAFAILLTHFLYAQTPITVDIPKFTPPSPTAYELGRYGEVPIGMFTGSLNASVPLLEYKTQELTIPITLAYNSNGIKVDDLGTKVGLGWVINTGGIISRTTKGGPDELRALPQPVAINENYRSDEFINYYYTIEDLGSYTDSQSSLVYDSEPDFFNFNFLGRSGRFTFNNSGNIVLLSEFSLKVTYNPEGSGGFLIIDEQGIKYYFTTNEDSRLDTIGDNGSSHMGTYSSTSWSITKIVTPNGDTINFNYTNEIYTYTTTKEQSINSWGENYPVNSSGPAMCSITPHNPYEGPIISQILNVKGKRIASISSTNPMYGTVNFDYNIAHPEVANYGMLSSMTLKNNQDIIVEKADLSYTTISQRMFLNEVKFLDPTKKYNFEYENINNVPARLSFAKDYWGYFNGKYTNTKLYPNLSGINKPLENLFHGTFPNGANRNLDETKAKTGLLKKLAYPTKGYSEFEYESNDYSVGEYVSTMTPANLTVATSSQDPIYAEKSTTLTLTNLPEAYSGALQISFGINYPVCYSAPNSYPSDRKLFIQITDLTNPANTNIITLSGQSLPSYSNSIIINENDVNMNNYVVNFIQSHSYTIKVSVWYQCLKGVVQFNYPSTSGELVTVTKKTGGLRVSKVTNKESDGTFLSSKKYFYASKDNLGMSSGTYPQPLKFFSNSYEGGVCYGGSGYTYISNYSFKYYNLNSNDLSFKYNPEYQNSRYQYVTVSEDNDQFGNGGVEYKFKVNSVPQMSPNAIVFGNFLEVWPEDENSWGDGLNLETTTFKKNSGGFKILRKEISTYQRDSRINEIIHGFKIVKKWTHVFVVGDVVPYIPEDELPLYQAQDELDVTKYDITTNWYYLSSKAVQVFDTNGLNPVETVTSYVYDNPAHCQLSQIRTNNSNDTPTITKMYYPDDVATTSSLGLNTVTSEAFAAFNKLKTPTPSNPNALHQNGKAIQTDTYGDANNDGVASSSELLYSKRINYKDWGNNNVLPKSIQTLKGVYNSSSNYLQDRIQFYSYYTDAKVKEFSQEGGSHIIYIWGYNKTQPIAKIENFTATQLAVIQTSLIDPAVTASNSDTTPATEETLRTKLNNIRNNTALVGAMVTTFTYDPVKGVTSMTDPKGYTIYYEYDTFGRLEFVKDKDPATGNFRLLSENKYNYKP